MKIDATFSADLVGLKLSYHEDTGTRVLTVSLAVEVSDKEAKAILGPEFHAVAFASMGNASGEPTWPYKSMVPTIVCERHLAHLCGVGPLSVQPEIRSIRPVRSKAAIVVDLRLPFVLEQASVAGAIAAQFGEVVDVQLQSSQQELPLDGAAVTVRKKKGRFGNPDPVVTGNTAEPALAQ